LKEVMEMFPMKVLMILQSPMIEMTRPRDVNFDYNDFSMNPVLDCIVRKDGELGFVDKMHVLDFNAKTCTPFARKYEFILKGDNAVECDFPHKEETKRKRHTKKRLKKMNVGPINIPKNLDNLDDIKI
jgi:hypothetical protein